MTHSTDSGSVQYTFAVRDSGSALHLEWLKYESLRGKALCGRSVRRWFVAPGRRWDEDPQRRCSQCEGPMGSKATVKP